MDLASTLGRRFKFEFLGRTIYVLSSALLTVILARLLDPDGYGLLFLAISILGVIKLFSRLGIAGSTSKYLATYKERDPSQIPHILRMGLFLNLAVLIITCILLYYFHHEISGLVGERELIPFLLIGVSYIFFSTLNYFALSALQGFEAIETTAVIRGIRGIVKFSSAIGLVLLGFGAIGALIGYVIAYAMATIIGLFYIYINFFKVPHQGSPEPGLFRRIAEYSIPITATGTASTIDRYLDTVLVGFFLGPVAVGYYTISKQVISFIEMPASALGFTLSPTYETQREQGNLESTAQIFEEGLTHNLLSYIPAATGLILVSQPTIELIFGTEYMGAVPILQILAIYVVFHTVNKIVGSGLDYLGRARERAILRGGSAGLNVILNLILIPSFGVIGAAIATVISYSLYSISNLYIMSTEIRLRHVYILKYLLIVIAISSAMGSIIFILLPTVNGFISLLLLIALGIMVWGILVTTLGLLDIRQVVSAIT